MFAGTYGVVEFFARSLQRRGQGREGGKQGDGKGRTRGWTQRNQQRTVQTSPNEMFPIFEWQIDRVVFVIFAFYSWTKVVLSVKLVKITPKSIRTYVQTRIQITLSALSDNVCGTFFSVRWNWSTDGYLRSVVSRTSATGSAINDIENFGKYLFFH